MTRSVTAVLTAAVTAMSLALVPGASAAHAAAAGQGTTCAPTTRSIDTLTYATTVALSPRGHVVANEADPGANDSLWLHRPNGTKTAIAFDDGTRPRTASDVSARGVTVGSAVRYPTLGARRSWISTGGTATWLPERTSANSFVAQSVNGAGAVVGVDTNITNSLPGETDFFADPIVWPTATDLPQSLPMPDGAFEVAFDSEPLINLRNDGRVSAVLVDYSGGATYLAGWATVASAPTLVEIPHGLSPTDVAGRWVVGRVGIDMFVFSPRAAVQISTATTMGRMSVAANGTYTAMRDSGGGIVGRGTAPPRDAAAYGNLTDVTGGMGGQVATGTSSTAAVLTCALGLPAATDTEVTPIVVG